jgi:cyanate permease
MLPLAMAMAWLCWRWIPAPAVAANDGNNSGNNNSGNNAATPAGGWRGMLLAPDWPNSRLRWLMGVQWCVGVALSAFVTFLPLFAHGNGLSVAQGGMLLALFGAMGLLSRVVLTPLAARMRDESRLLCGLLLVAAAGLLLLMQSGQASWPLWLAAALMGLTAVATNAIAMAMLLRDAQFGPPAQSASLLSVAFFAGMASGPALFGWSLDQGRSFGFAWLVLVGVLLLGALLASALSLLRARAGTAVAPQPGTEATIAGGRQA